MVTGVLYSYKNLLHDGLFAHNKITGAGGLTAGAQIVVFNRYYWSDAMGCACSTHGRPRCTGQADIKTRLK
jgi:hypothetical protein